MGQLDGQVALVTGAGRGIGRTIAEAIARAGAPVGLCARTDHDVQEVAAAIRARGGKAAAVAVDVTERSAVEQAVATIEESLGPISLLVNNAGTLDAVGPLWEVEPELWWRDVEVHVKGTLLSTHAVLPGMVGRGAGRIINVLGLLGQRGEPYVSAYACAKAALFRLTDCLANELRDEGIQVFCISPGPVLTRMTRRFLEDDHAQTWVPVFAEMPQSEWVSGDEGAALVVRLARGDADVLAGRFLHVADDLDALLARADEITSSDHLSMRVLPAP